MARVIRATALSTVHIPHYTEYLTLQSNQVSFHCAMSAAKQ